MKFISVCSLIILSAVVAGCASKGGSESGGASSHHYEDVDVSKIKDPVPKHEPKSQYGNPSSYKVFGKTYHVKDSSHGFKERGHASWYGHPFHGRRTSSGEEYDMYKMTAAHKTVPIPCYMRVTNLKSGKTIIVRVNDRGPFHDGRVIDLSYVAAKKLGVHAEGTVPVEIEVITPENYKPAEESPLRIVPPPNQTPTLTHTALNSTPVTQQPGQIYLQVAAYADGQRAQYIAEQIHRIPNSPNTQVVSGYSNNQPIYRVHVGPFTNMNQAQQFSQQVTQIYPDTRPMIIK